MSIIAKVRAMFGTKPKTRASNIPDPLEAQRAIALQRNEIAGERARRVLEEIKMAQTVRGITGKM